MDCTYSILNKLISKILRFASPKVIDLYKKNQIKLVCRKAFLMRLGYGGDNYIPVINHGEDLLDVSNYLRKKYPKAQFVLAYYDNKNNKRVWRFLSIMHGKSEIQSHCGGISGADNVTVTTSTKFSPIKGSKPMLSLYSFGKETFNEAFKKAAKG